MPPSFEHHVPPGIKLKNTVGLENIPGLRRFRSVPGRHLADLVEGAHSLAEKYAPPKRDDRENEEEQNWPEALHEVMAGSSRSFRPRRQNPLYRNARQVTRDPAAPQIRGL